MQIARGRAGISMFNEVISPALSPLSLLESNGTPNADKLQVIYGYRSTDYFDYTKINSDFIFVNVGMFAVLTNSDIINVGMICNPIISYSIIDSTMRVSNEAHFDDNKNILNKFNDISKIILFGIADNMPFITPDIYPKTSIDTLINNI
jgi:hypothetical protein